MPRGQAGHGDAQGDAGGHRARDPLWPARVRLRDHCLAAGEGLLGHRRGDRLRAADQDRAARLRGRGEGALREGTAAQGLHPQRSGTGVPRRLLEDLELPHRTARTAPRRRQVDMAAKWIEMVTGSLEQKKQYRQYKARIEALPEPYVTVAKALERYFMYNAGVMEGDTALKMFSDFADLWERAVADGTPVRAIVGADPVEFADTFAQAYT